MTETAPYTLKVHSTALQLAVTSAVLRYMRQDESGCVFMPRIHKVPYTNVLYKNDVVCENHVHKGDKNATKRLLFSLMNNNRSSLVTITSVYVNVNFANHYYYSFNVLFMALGV